MYVDVAGLRAGLQVYGFPPYHKQAEPAVM